MNNVVYGKRSEETGCIKLISVWNACYKKCGHVSNAIFIRAFDSPLDIFKHVH